ncbi:MAG TPA: DUF5667 domain-containing protein [Candidatus Limnocylindrales bacterium]|nr:DUF5667 domain-containing protein [Candidatus Limnocylindrales bacterium]
MKYQIRKVSRVSKVSSVARAFLVSLVILMVLFSTTTVSAQEGEPDSTKSTYTLSYPGLLPDHPLYFLKAGRDRMMSIFISKPLEKAEFNLLQADKRVEASFMLSEKKENKLDLSQSTFSKAENYFEAAINQTMAAKTQGINTSEVSKKLKDANKKHQQILKDITNKLKGKDKNKFAVEHGRLRDFEKRVKEVNR